MNLSMHTLILIGLETIWTTVWEGQNTKGQRYSNYAAIYKEKMYMKYRFELESVVNDWWVVADSREKQW